MKIDTRHVCLVLLALGWQGRALAQQAVPASQPAAPGTPSAAAPESGYVDLMGGLAYTDNARLTRGQGASDGIGTAGLNVDYQRLGNLSLNLLGNLERLQYLRGSFGGSFYGNFFGSGVLGKPTDLLQWQLFDSFGEEMTDPLASPTPLNLQTINDVTTGPLVNLHFGLTNRLTLFGVYSRTTYQRSPFDSQTYQGGARFRHALPGASTISLSASTAHTQYIDRAAVQGYFPGASTNYNIQEASLSYHAKLVRTEVLLQAGYNTIQYGGASRRGAPLYQVRISRQISPFSTVYLDGEQIYATNGSSLGSPGARVGLQTGASLNPGYAVAQPFNQRSAGVGWLFTRARTSLSLMGGYQDQIFDQTSANTKNYNHKYETVGVILGRQLRPTLRVQLSAQGYWDRYGQLNATTRRENIGLTFSKRLARTMVWFYVERRHQSGSPGQSAFLTSSYNDDVIGVYVTYDLFGQRHMQPSMQQMPGMSSLMGGYGGY